LNLETGKPIAKWPDISSETGYDSLALINGGRTVITWSKGWGTPRNPPRLLDSVSLKPVREPFAYDPPCFYGKYWEQFPEKPFRTFKPSPSSSPLSVESLQLYDPVMEQSIGEPLRHRGRINGYSSNQDGKILLTWAEDKTIRFWDTTTARPLGPPFSVEANWGADGKVQFSQDNKVILVQCREYDRDGKVPEATFYKTEIHPGPGRPVNGEVKRLVLWSQVITGMELTSQGGTRFLDAATWRDRRRILSEMGGPPVP
jgi:WD40 repeat protein